MPSTSKKQWRLMARAAADKKFAKKFGIDQAVAKEFRAADVALANKDPEHYHNLPDEAPGKKKDDESMEGRFSEIFGAVASRLLPSASGNKNNSTVLETPIWELVSKYVKSNWWGNVKPKEGGNFVLSRAQPLFNFGTTTGNLFDDLDHGIHQIKGFYEPYMKLLAAESIKLEKAYEDAKKSAKSPEDVVKATTKALASFEHAMQRIHPPTVNLGNIHATKTHNGWKIERPASRTPIQLMSKVDVQKVKRLCTLMHETAQLLDKWHDDYLSSHGPALIDGKAETGWWDKHFPEAEEERDTVLNALPINGEFPNHDFPEYVEVVENALRGMAIVLGIIADIPE